MLFPKPIFKHFLAVHTITEIFWLCWNDAVVYTFGCFTQRVIKKITWLNLLFGQLNPWNLFEALLAAPLASKIRLFNFSGFWKNFVLRQNEATQTQLCRHFNAKWLSIALGIGELGISLRVKSFADHFKWINHYNMVIN